MSHDDQVADSMAVVLFWKSAGVQCWYMTRDQTSTRLLRRQRIRRDIETACATVKTSSSSTVGVGDTLQDTARLPPGDCYTPWKPGTKAICTRAIRGGAV
jgi:hypothetical protein